MPPKGKRKADDDATAAVPTRFSKRQKDMRENIEKEKAKKAEASSSKTPKTSKVPKVSKAQGKVVSEKDEVKKTEASSSTASKKSKAQKEVAFDPEGEVSDSQSKDDSSTGQDTGNSKGHSETTVAREGSKDNSEDKPPAKDDHLEEENATDDLSAGDEKDLSLELVQLIPPLSAIAETSVADSCTADAEAQPEAATPSNQEVEDSDESDDEYDVDQEADLSFEEAVELKPPTWEILEGSRSTSSSSNTSFTPETPGKYLKSDRRAELFKGIGGVGKYTYPPRTPRDKTLTCKPRSISNKKESPLKGSPSGRG